MKLKVHVAWALAAALMLSLAAAWAKDPPLDPVAKSESGKSESAKQSADSQRGLVKCANLIYAENKTSVCFSSEFLAQIAKETNIVTNPKVIPVKLESPDLFQYPFAVMTGEGAFVLNQQQKSSLRDYLTNGGFVVASAGCSSAPWASSFKTAIAEVLPDTKLVKLDFTHPIFHTVFEINQLECKRSGQAHLEGLEIDGKIVLIFSSDGLNDTGKAGGNCCCCGGNEILNARQVNMNLLAYTLTH